MQKGSGGFSAFKNAVQSREHYERAYPAHRAKLGLLEKKKDYLKRARNHHKKQKRKYALQRKAQERNPDEFYFGMVKGQTADGVHKAMRDGPKLSKDMLALLKTQDEAYVVTKRYADLKKAYRLKDRIHGTAAPKPSTRLVFVGADEGTARGRKRKRSEQELGAHGDDQIAVEPAVASIRHAPAFKGKAAQRLAQLGVISGSRSQSSAGSSASAGPSSAEAPSSSEGPISKDAARSIMRETRRVTKRRRLSQKASDKLAVRRQEVVREAEARTRRAKVLGRAVAHLQHYKALGTKGSRVKVADAKGGLPAQFRWKRERKR